MNPSRSYLLIFDFSVYLTERRLATQRRCFSASPYFQGPPRSPNIRERQRALKRARRTGGVPQFPSELLTQAHSSGALPFGCNEALRFLEDFDSTLPRPGSPALRELCKTHNVTPQTLTILAHIIRRSGSERPSRFEQASKFAKQLLVCASSLKESSATLLLMSEAIKSRSPDQRDTGEASCHLADLAKGEEPTAMLLYGNLLEVQGKPGKALELYERVIEQDYETSVGVYGQAWEHVGRLKARKGDWKGAKLAIEQAALRFDQPMAYYILAKDYTDPLSPEWLKYMLKAAASGISEAAQHLGLHYDKQWKGEIPVPRESENPRVTDDSSTGVFATYPQPVLTATRQKKQALAREWFSVAAESGLAFSQISLARLLRKADKVDEGMQWLDRAEADGGGEWASNIAWLKERWWDTTTDLTLYKLKEIKEQDTI